MNHISIEGMDGVGKSTVCRLLAEKLGYEFVEKPNHFLFDEKEAFSAYGQASEFVNERANRNITAMFYGLGSILMYDIFKDKNIVTDRHLASNYAWNSTDYNKDIFDLVVKKTGAPKITIILYAKPEIIYDRMKTRSNNDSDLRKIDRSEIIFEKNDIFL